MVLLVCNITFLLASLFTDDGFNNVSMAGNSIQLVDINSRAFAQQVMVPNGNTLILSGFEQQRNQVSKEGFGVENCLWAAKIQVKCAAI